MTDYLLPAFQFEITLRRSPQITAGADVEEDTNAVPTGQALGDGAFAECTGLEVEMDVQEYLEGGRNDGVIQQVGRAKYSNIVLKRGMFHNQDDELNRDLWNWLQDIVSGRPVARYDGIIAVKGRDNTVKATWVFERGLPAKVRGPELNAKTGQVAIEELHIAHEGLRLIGG